MPLRYLLGGVQDTVATYASGGYYRAGDPRDNLTAEIERYRELGFTDFKLKFGGLPLREDLERVAAARRALDPGARLAVDVNNAWRTLGQALEAIEALAEYDIWWVEEPFAPDDIANHALLTAHSPIPIATGEIEATRWGFRRAFRPARRRHLAARRMCHRRYQRVVASRDPSGGGVHRGHSSLARQPPRTARGDGAELPCRRVLRPRRRHLQLRATRRQSAHRRRRSRRLDQTPGIGVEIDWEAVDWWLIPPDENITTSSDQR